jgi:short-subunit dehydrogenase
VTSVVIAGATSAIAQAVAREFAQRGAKLVLIGRDAAKLEVVSADLRSRGAEVETIAADLAACDAQQLASDCERRFGRVDAVLIAHGSLPDQRLAENDVAATLAAMTTNGTSAIALAAAFASILDRQNAGVLALLGSVAGDRGRRSNYTYGAAKAAVQTYFDGLAGRFAATPVRALTFKLGFVDTPMTAHLKKNALYATPAAVGAALHRAMTSRARGVVYVPHFWRWIMLIVRAMPASLIARLRL